MYKSKVTVAMMVAVLFVGAGIGAFVSRNWTQSALADDSDGGKKVDHNDLEEIYQAAFGRPVDAEGERFHLGKDLKQVLHDVNDSPEHRYYGALFLAVKAYEHAIRAPGDLSAADKELYLNNINSAMATLVAWVETLPEQDICHDGLVGPERARQAIQDAFARMSPEAQAHAKRGLFRALDVIGGPNDQHVPFLHCASPTPEPSHTPRPSHTPEPSETPEHTPTPTPTPSESPSPTATP